MNKNTKILFTDLDGTLLTSDKHICSDNIKAIKKMIDKNHIFAVNTGRPFNAAHKLLKEINMDKNCYILSFHGTNVYDCHNKKVINAQVMNTDCSIDVLRAMDNENIHSQAFTYDMIYTTKDDDILREYNRYTNENVTIVKDYDELSGLKLHKIMAIDFENHDRLETFKEKYIDITEKYFNNFFSCSEYLEYTLKGANKGDGVRFLANYLNIPVGNTIAVGDEGNDIPMINMAGIGVCMINGHIKVKRVADYVTKTDNNNGAIAEIIYKYIL